MNGYDANGLLRTVTTASGQSEASTLTYAYTPAGQRASLTDGNGNATLYAYDGFGRLQTTSYAATASSAVTTEVLAYDAASNAPPKHCAMAPR